MKSATLPPVRVTPDVRDTVESALREGETLGEFIEASVLEAAAWRRVQSEFVARGQAALERWRREGGGYTLDEVMDDLVNSRTLDWTLPKLAITAIREGMRFLAWSPFTCRKARLSTHGLRELVIPFGGTGYIALFDIVADEVVVVAVRHQREQDYRH